jgi:hypothetical protein
VVLIKVLVDISFGPVDENGICRKRFNLELFKVFNEPDIIKSIKVKRLEWIGHVLC